MLLRREIKSFVRRGRSLSPAQQLVHNELWREYGITAWQDEKIARLIPNAAAPATCVLEIGFGNGENLLQLAQQSPEKFFIGVEVHRPGLAQVLGALKVARLKNLLLYEGDVVEFLREAPNEMWSEVWILFPDPWPKKRHHKRRLLQPKFLALLHAKLKVGGMLHLATDWEPYAASMLELLAGDSRFVRTQQPQHLARPVVTKFEKRGLAREYQVCDLVFIKS